MSSSALLNDLLGVVDTHNKQDNNNKNLVRYSSNGNTWVAGVVSLHQGIKGFKYGETITMDIDLNSGTIKWRVGS